MNNNQMNQNNNNFQGNKNNNNNNNMQNNQNQNVNNNFIRNHYQPGEQGSIMATITQNSNLIDKNEINEINNIVQQVYSYKVTQKEGNEYMSDIICSKIKHKIHGDWFVFISDANNNINKLYSLFLINNKIIYFNKMFFLFFNYNKIINNRVNLNFI